MTAAADFGIQQLGVSDVEIKLCEQHRTWWRQNDRSLQLVAKTRTASTSGHAHSTLTGHSLISPVTKEINQQIHKYHTNKCRVNYWTMTMKILSENLQCCTRTKWTFFPSPLAKHKHSLRIQNIIRIRINLDSNPDVCRTAPKILQIHYLVSISHFTECRANRPVTVWEMLINLLKSPISEWWRKWKSDLESVSGSGSPSKVEQFSRLVGPIITPSLNDIGWLLLQ